MDGLAWHPLSTCYKPPPSTDEIDICGCRTNTAPVGSRKRTIVLSRSIFLRAAHILETAHILRAGQVFRVPSYRSICQFIYLRFILRFIDQGATQVGSGPSASACPRYTKFPIRQYTISRLAPQDDTCHHRGEGLCSNGLLGNRNTRLILRLDVFAGGLLVERM